MAAVPFSQQVLGKLKGKVVVLTGGAQGVGAATVGMAHRAGAHVFFGDWADDKGKQVEASVRAEHSGSSGSVHFQKVDVRQYASQLALFDTAYKAHGRVDVAVSCAAVTEAPGFFEPENLDLEAVREEPQDLRSRLDINLTSVLMFSRMALAYMKASPPAEDFSRSMVLVSSIAGITEAPGLFAYSTAKHGVIGLMRALRPYTPSRYGVRVNAICPWATDTQLLAGVKDRWIQEKLPLNQPENVAEMILQCAADETLNGKSVFVAGGKGYDTEEGYDRTQAQWMGEELTAEFNRGQKVLGLGDGWTSK
ncbi:uncharacterized protein E0L32_009445 [Thyridium curvatum]|uniref:Uncharacterized protein n=1 Tax=Thyridium curvatum TaxID=1093900 RepID=A0A507AWV6_9PEZI|nr:uncharacterized protein E0L32_009445 [Thyridium curvatum]TPX09401.1 hypothetical protein E0L32_009445 [Thyridium curvatum]